MFIGLKLFIFLHINTTMHAHTSHYYCYLHYYFFVCALSVITFVVSFDSFRYHFEQWGKSSCLILLNTIFLRLVSFHIFYAFTFILQDILTLFSYYYFPDYLTNKTTQFIIFSGDWSLFYSTTKNTTYFTSSFVLCSTSSKTHDYLFTFFLPLYFLYSTCSSCCNHSLGQNGKSKNEDFTDRTFVVSKYLY